MGGYNEITLPKWQDLVRRRFGLVGPGSNVPVLASEITPAAIVEPHRFEHELLAKVRHFEHSLAIQPDAAGNDVLVELRNPVGSGKFLVVTRVHCHTHHEAGLGDLFVNGPQLYINDWNLNPLAAWAVGPLTFAVATDHRSPVLYLSTGNFYSDGNVGALPAFSQGHGTVPVLQFTADGEHVVSAITFPSLLPPGWSMDIFQEGAALDDVNFLDTMWEWYEWDLEVAESLDR